LISLNTKPDQEHHSEFKPWRMQMPKKPSDKQANVVDRPVTLETQKQAIQRRAFQDTLEDDEAFEALMSLRPKKQKD